MRNRAENQIKLAFIRHGETPSNALGKYLGRTEEDLSEKGQERLLQNKTAGKYPYADLIFSSPMKRCLQTAELIYGEVCPIVMEEWSEMDFGRFEGKNYLELSGNVAYQAWIDSNGELPFPGGESRQDFIARCLSGLAKAITAVMEQKKQGNQPVEAAAVVHGGTIMALLSSCCGGNYFDYQCKNGEGFQVFLYLSKTDTPEMKLIGKL